MNMTRTTLAMLLSVPLCLPLLGGCNSPSQSSATQPAAQPAAAAGQPETALGKVVARAIGEARAKLAKENINLNGEFHSGGHRNVVARVGGKDPADTRPNAELTPAGELLLDGRPVPTDARQHLLLVQYRQAIMTVAERGMALGVQGADLGGHAVGEVLKGLMSGNPDQIDKNINAKARSIEAQAMLLCKELRPVQELQQKLAVALPQFAPYATLKASDVEDCGKDHGNGNSSVTTSDSERAEIQQDVRQAVREGIRSGIRDSIRSAVRPGEPAVARVDASPANLIEAVETQRIEEIRRQVKAGVDVNARVRGDGTPLIRAAAASDLAIVDELIRLGADVNKPSRGDGNPLIAAAKGGRLDIVKRLVAAGAAIDAEVPGDETALINAARGGHLDVVTYLVERGANVNLGVFADYGRWRSPLNQATDAGVRKYLQGKGARAGRDA